jgi:hypothetical protein
MIISSVRKVSITYQCLTDVDRIGSVTEIDGLIDAINIPKGNGRHNLVGCGIPIHSEDELFSEVSNYPHPRAWNTRRRRHCPNTVP